MNKIAPNIPAEFQKALGIPTDVDTVVHVPGQGSLRVGRQVLVTDLPPEVESEFRENNPEQPEQPEDDTPPSYTLDGQTIEQEILAKKIALTSRKKWLQRNATHAFTPSPTHPNGNRKTRRLKIKVKR